MDDVKLVAIAAECRVQIIRMLTHAGSGHPGGSLSVIDLVTTLFFERMRHDPKRPEWPDRYRLVLSKGHAVPALFAAMARAGYSPEDRLITLRIDDNLSTVLNHVVGITKDVKGTIVWAADEVAYVPEIAVRGVHVREIAGFMEDLP